MKTILFFCIFGALLTLVEVKVHKVMYALIVFFVLFVCCSLLDNDIHFVQHSNTTEVVTETIASSPNTLPMHHIEIEYDNHGKLIKDTMY